MVVWCRISKLLAYPQHGMYQGYVQGMHPGGKVDLGHLGVKSGSMIQVGWHKRFQISDFQRLASPIFHIFHLSSAVTSYIHSRRDRSMKSITTDRYR